MYYFIGIKGSGMAPLATILYELGNEVAGSDIDKYIFIEDELRKRNIPIYSFNKDNIKDGYHVIIGNAFDESNEEVKAALENPNVKCTRYYDFLADFMEHYVSIAVAGTHGKTTTTANIGIGLSSAGKKVLVIDTDLGLRNLDVVLGLENRIVYNLVDVIESKCRLKQAVIKDTRFENLYLLPSAQTKDKTSVSPEQMKKLIDELKDDYDFILLDCPAGIEQGFKNAIAGAQRSIVVTTPEVSSIRDADRIIGLLEASGIRKNELLINRLRVDMVRRGDMMSVEDVTEILAIDLLGVIPDDESVVVATNQGEPVVGEDSLAGKCYQNICRRLLGEEVPISDFNHKPGLRSKLSSLFHKN